LREKKSETYPYAHSEEGIHAKGDPTSKLGEEESVYYGITKRKKRTTGVKASRHRLNRRTTALSSKKRAGLARNYSLLWGILRKKKRTETGRDVFKESMGPSASKREGENSDIAGDW